MDTVNEFSRFYVTDKPKVLKLELFRYEYQKNKKRFWRNYNV